MDDAEKIVEMTQWEDFKRWECSSENEVAPNADEENLLKAQRFISAQSFMLAWQQGKVPVGWIRPRRLDDFNGLYPPKVLDEALDRIEERIAARNEALTAQLAMKIASGSNPMSGAPASEKRRAGASGKSSGGAGEVEKKEVERLKKMYGEFNLNVYSTKVALSNASTAVAELLVKTVELEKRLSAAPSA
eukprot:Plantae.Rhodophyta-Hildenbrandia_rubra.ctg28319.p1 GENE.Plantae.Rhodophyta-Hildenbrandia_rubra.ctg28319~~Plantae.Rhodophyta-Hildenbrandia_rubra.ctg28319.p1  ORF type:complete len:190 (+),score=45.10 Plantae.Rhodophyta-Hildenbrandia_rubra.ctg28319:181-750(+)